MANDAGRAAAQVGFLSTLAPASRQRLSARGRRRAYARGEEIFARGEPGDALLIVETGYLEISVRRPGGRKAILNYVGAGEVIGEITVIDRSARSADVIALEPTTGLIVDGRDVRAVLLEDPVAMMVLLERVCDKLRSTIDAFEALGQREAVRRLARCLVRLGATFGNQAEPAEPTILPATISQSDLGDFAGLSRENVNRQIKRWVADGVVALENGRLILRDTEALREITDA
ncbi:MAG: Crp/Fnr family transcriptional regulator [Pseudomonadota bacterium]